MCWCFGIYAYQYNFLETTQLISEPKIFLIEEEIQKMLWTIQLLSDYSWSRNFQLGRKTSQA